MLLSRRTRKRRTWTLRALLARPSRKKDVEYVFYVELSTPNDFETQPSSLLEPVSTNVQMLGKY